MVQALGCVPSVDDLAARKAVCDRYGVLFIYGYFLPECNVIFTFDPTIYCMGGSTCLS